MHVICMESSGQPMTTHILASLLACKSKRQLAKLPTRKGRQVLALLSHLDENPSNVRERNAHAVGKRGGRQRELAQRRRHLLREQREGVDIDSAAQQPCIQRRRRLSMWI